VGGLDDAPPAPRERTESSLRFDLLRKGSLYARAGIRDYWIVNLVDCVLEAHRDPAPEPTAPWGWAYRSVATLAPPATVALIGVSAVEVAVADLLP